MSDDDALMDELRAVLAPDPVPAAVLAAARATFTWRSVDEELAQLLSDSADLALTGVRGAGDRRLSFEAPQLVIEFVRPRPARVAAGRGSSRRRTGPHRGPARRGGHRDRG